MVASKRFQQSMSRALFLAHRCAETGDVPVGAVVIDPSGRIVSEGWNQREADHDPTAHAEITALRDAGTKLGSWNLSGCALVVTLEPCTMCAGAIVSARISTLVFGAWDEKAGAVGSVRDVARDSRLNHQVEVIAGVMETEASVQLKGFFAEKRMQAEKQESDFWHRRPSAISSMRSPSIPHYLPAPNSPAAVSPIPPITRRSDQHRDHVYVPPLQTQ